MAAHHASSGEIVSLRPLAERLPEAQSVALVRDDRIELLRLVLPAGKQLPEHFAYGPVTIQCLEGVVEIAAHDTVRAMRAGDLMYLAAEVPHAVRATEDALVLVTMVLRDGPA